MPFRFAGDAALFQRPEVRDVLAWLRMLADPTDSAAVVRAVTRPPVELRSIDLARCTAIARRRKLDMISALEAALESPQLPPEARDRIQAFLKLHHAAAGALEEIRADVFVRRLIERIGLRRHRLFVATPEAAERLQSLSRLSELAAAWTRREPRGSVRDFVRHLTAVADAGELDPDDAATPRPGEVVLAEPEQVKGLEFEHVYLLGPPSRRDRGARPRRGLDPAEAARRAARRTDGEEPPRLAPAPPRPARLAYLAMTRARVALVLSWPEAIGEGPIPPSAVLRGGPRCAGAPTRRCTPEELFGPAEGLHSTYRMLRDEVLEASWRAGSALSEMRLDTAEDVTQAVARYLELIKLAALVQRPGAEPAAEALAALNELLGRAASPEQRAALEASALDEYVIGEERDLAARRELVAARREPSLEQFIPRRGEGLALSASDIDLYRTCPLKYKFARVFAIPQEPTINQRFGILIHQVLERFHSEQLRADASGGRRVKPGAAVGRRREPRSPAGPVRGGLAADRVRLLGRRAPVPRSSGGGAGPLPRASAALRVEARLAGAQLRVRDRLPSAPRPGRSGRPATRRRLRADRLQDRRAQGDRRPRRAARPLPARRPRGVADRGRARQLLVRAGGRARAHGPGGPDDAERVERTVLEVGAGIEGQDFEPRPSYEICSWCDYRLICPASEA